MEALIYHFKIVTEGFRVPAGEVYQVIESPRGELGYYVVSDGTTQPVSRAHADAQLREPAGDVYNGRRHPDRGRDRFASAAWTSFLGIRTGEDVLALYLDSNDFFTTTGSQVRQASEELSSGAAAVGDDPDAALRAGRGGLGHRRTDRRSGAARRRHPAAGERGAVVLLHAAPQAAGEVSRPDLHQHQLPAARRRQALGARLRRSWASATRKSPPTDRFRSKKWSAWAPAPGRRPSR